jgi:hypothetical protein
VLEAHQARLHGRDFSIMVRSQLWSRVILVARMRSRIWAMLAAVKLREHYSLYVASVEGVPQDPLVRLSPSALSTCLGVRPAFSLGTTPALPARQRLIRL